MVGGGIVIEREVEALARAALQKPPSQRQAIAGTIATMLKIKTEGPAFPNTFKSTPI